MSMKIGLKETALTHKNGATVNQGGWKVLHGKIMSSYKNCSAANEMVALGQIEFSFSSTKVERFGFSYSPSDFFDPARKSYYQGIGYCSLQIEGKALGVENLIRSHHVPLQPTFDYIGWSVGFDNLVVKESFTEFLLTAEGVIADLVCAESIKLSWGLMLSDGTTRKLVYATELPDVEGLRQAVNDALGPRYLEKLLRINGYEIIAER